MRLRIALAAATLLIAVCLLVPSGLAEVSVAEINENHGSDWLVVDIRCPVVSGLADAALQEELNARIRRQIARACAAAHEQARTAWQREQARGFAPWTYIFTAQYAVKCSRGVLSLGVTTLLDMGGPDQPGTVYYNVDLVDGRLLRLPDLFAADAPYRRTLGAAINAAVAADPDRYFLPLPEVTADTAFFISEGQLFITYAKYEIASGATGEPAFAIPGELLAGMLRPEYEPWFVR